MQSARRRLANWSCGIKPLLRQQGEIRGALDRLKAMETTIDQKTRDLTQTREEQEAYEELRRAFGKAGVQALIIETMLPHIERRANVLIGRMTDNRMHLKLETQRSPRSRSGDPIETLEIIISDELGPELRDVQRRRGFQNQPGITDCPVESSGNRKGALCPLSSSTRGSALRTRRAESVSWT